MPDDDEVSSTLSAWARAFGGWERNHVRRHISIHVSSFHFHLCESP